MNNKQSSVDYLFQNIFEISQTLVTGGESQYELMKKAYDQAKAMHKEEMEFCFQGGMSLVEGRLWKPIDLFDEFYNEKFNNNQIKN